jgi:hypothetical protein
VYLGLGLRLGSGTFAGYDADAAAYFNRATVTDATAKQQINAFVVGIKALGLWSSLLCWPTRSSQNKGSGNTIYSLGGLQTSDATKTGGTWGTDGIFFSGATEYMTSTLTSNLPRDATLFLSAKGNGSSYSSYPMLGGVFDPSAYYNGQLCFSGDNNSSIMAFALAQPSTFDYTGFIIHGLSGASSFNALSGSYKRNSVFNIRNLSLSTTATQSTYPADVATTLTKVSLNGRWQGSAAQLGNPMTASFFAIITPNCDSVISSFHNLYKTTLGTGLGLP